MKLTIALPIPDKVLSPNSRAHWARRARATKEARTTAYLLATKELREKSVKPPKWETAELHVTFYWPTAHRRDADNAWRRMKPVMDGLEDAGIIQDDAGFILYPPTMTKDAANPRVEVTVQHTTDSKEAA